MYIVEQTYIQSSSNRFTTTISYYFAVYVEADCIHIMTRCVILKVHSLMIVTHNDHGICKPELLEVTVARSTYVLACDDQYQQVYDIPFGDVTDVGFADVTYVYVCSLLHFVNGCILH